MHSVRRTGACGCTLLLALTMLGASPPVGYDRQVALIVGISDYRGERDSLPNAKLDARNFAQLMRKRGLHEADVITLYDRQATRRNILAAMDKAIARAGGKEGRDRSLLVVYFAGHGEAGNGTGVLVPHPEPKKRLASADYISMTEIRDRAAVAKGVRHQLYVFASCFSGTVFRSNASEIKSRPELQRKASAAQWMAANLEQRSRFALAAGGQNQQIYDGPPGLGSRFGSAVVKALTKAPGDSFAEADANEDSCVTMYELASYVEANGSYPGKQDPYAGRLHDTGDELGKVAFCDPMARPRPASEPPGPPRKSLTASKLVLDSTPHRPKMVFIPRGAFWMGSAKNGKGRKAAENRREVTLSKDYWLAESEVTQAQWQTVMDTNPSYFDHDRGGGSNHPVERVSWYDALEYLNRLSTMENLTACYRLNQCTGRVGVGCDGAYCDGQRSCKWVEAVLDCTGYRLPTEAEWERAARADQDTPLYSGPHNAAEVGRIGWYSGNSKSRTHPVKQKGKNAFGLYDMIGNVREWVEDGLEETKPTIESRPKMWVKPLRVVYRGCGWNDYARYCRIGLRNDESSVYRYHGLGFRPARSMTGP